MTYGSEIMPWLVDVWLKFKRADMYMIRWMCGVSLKDRRTSEELESWLEFSLSQRSLEVVG